MADYKLFLGSLRTLTPMILRLFISAASFVLGIANHLSKKFADFFISHYEAVKFLSRLSTVSEDGIHNLRTTLKAGNEGLPLTVFRPKRRTDSSTRTAVVIDKVSLRPGDKITGKQLSKALVSCGYICIMPNFEEDVNTEAPENYLERVISSLLSVAGNDQLCPTGRISLVSYGNSPGLKMFPATRLPAVEAVLSVKPLSRTEDFFSHNLSEMSAKTVNIYEYAQTKPLQPGQIVRKSLDMPIKCPPTVKVRDLRYYRVANVDFAHVESISSLWPAYILDKARDNDVDVTEEMGVKCMLNVISRLTLLALNILRTAVLVQKCAPFFRREPPISRTVIYSS